MEEAWVGLSEAAERLGVHPATLRAWADRGEIPCRRTAGGHRRFPLAEIESRLQGARPHDAGAQVMAQSALGKTRLELAAGRFAAEPWFQQLDEEARRRLAESGRRLLQLMQTAVASSADITALRQEARAAGAHYERLCHDSGLSLVETVRGFLIFRGLLSRTLIDISEIAGAQSPLDWAAIHAKVGDLSDEVLLALIAAADARHRVPGNAV